MGVKMKILSFILFFIVSLDLESTPLSKLKMKPGDIEKLSFNIGNSLHVTRKNVVDLESLGNGQWRIVALKKGIVMLVEKTPSGEEVARYLVVVESKKNFKKGGLLSFDSSWLNAICKEKSILCDIDRNRISGEIDSWRQLYQLRKMCNLHEPCLFDVNLSSQGKSEFETYLKNLVGSWFFIDVKENGKAVLLGDCKSSSLSSLKELVERLTGDGIKKKLLTVQCRNKLAGKNYILKAKAFLLKEGEAEKFGVSSILGSSFSLSIDKDFQWDQNIQAFLQKNRSRIVGEPLMRLYAGKKAIAQSGSEIAFRNDGDDPGIRWKRVGFWLEAKIHELEQRRYLLSYQLKLSSPQSSGQVLQSSGLTSETVMLEGVPRIVGEIDTTVLSSDKSSLPFFRKVPIIGPIFTGFQDSNVRTHLYLWMVVVSDSIGSGFKDVPKWPE